MDMFIPFKVKTKRYFMPKGTVFNFIGEKAEACMMTNYTPKQRMLNAYRGVFSDRYPVAPEFWYYFPAKVLGVSMVEFELDIPHWQALLETFRQYKTEGWGIASPNEINQDAKRSSKLIKQGDKYVLEAKTVYKEHVFESATQYSDDEPSWVTRHLVDDYCNLAAYMDMVLDEHSIFDFASANAAYDAVADHYLLEMYLGVPFFDFIASAMGFERAIFYFTEEKDAILLGLKERYDNHQLRLIDAACQNTRFESFFMGCSFSCNSLLGPTLWREFDKPGIKKIASRLHEHGKLLHVHFHGKCMETLSDFREIGIDCVCPFERGPGGDVNTLEDLKRVRTLLANQVTMNGNVHTVETLIRGTVQDVLREVSEIKEAFDQSPRLIIGTGDQVGRETREENLV